jgi:exodeoxyribonuclease VII large subunit
MPVLSVSDLNSYLAALLESDDVLRDIWVQGEVSGFKQYPSGHCYFSLKDEGGVLRGVMWKSYAARLLTLPANGDLVLAHGKVSVYAERGDLQLVVDSVQPAGIGLAQAQLEAIKQRLQAEGLFDRKRPLPLLPRRIGIVTSPQAAALRDMLNVLARRFPLAEVLIAPALVQGAQAPDSIVDALYTIYQFDLDLIILARGGGSIEDLWCFNDEAVVRAVFASPVPLITGVGHETDVTLVDFVADLRAPTPSAAAELATPELPGLQAALGELRRRLDTALDELLLVRRDELLDAERALQRLAPLARISRDRQRLDDLQRRMDARINSGVLLRSSQLNGLAARLDTLSPRATLARGYAIVRRASNGHVVTRRVQVTAAAELLITLSDGEIRAVTG